MRISDWSSDVCSSDLSLLYFNLVPLPQETLLTLHRVLAWSLVAYVVLHIAAQWAMAGWRGLLKILTPRLAYVAAAGVALSAAGAFAAGFFVLDQGPPPPLELAQTDAHIGRESWRE